tara:strand:- start:174 stop:440 length:267 start_codon:yes stop_codon:yes gene_type:complete
MLAINQLIKIVVGVVVIAVVVIGVYFFGSYVADFFGNMVGGEEEKQENVIINSEESTESQNKRGTTKDTQDSEGFIKKSWNNIKNIFN